MPHSSGSQELGQGQGIPKKKQHLNNFTDSIPKKNQHLNNFGPFSLTYGAKLFKCCFFFFQDSQCLQLITALSILRMLKLIKHGY